MKVAKRNFYFETSALNYFADNYGWQDAIATKDLQTSKDNKWYISPITLMEILVTSDADRREKLILIAQHLFHDKLLVSPSEFLINYIKAGCLQKVITKAQHTSLPIGKIWTILCGDKQVTIEVDHEELKRKFKVFYSFSKQIDKIVNRVMGVNIGGEPTDTEHTFQLVIDHYLDQIQSQGVLMNEDGKKVLKITLWYIILLLCIGVDIGNELIDKYWENLGISDPFDRIAYTLQENAVLLKRGPLSLMALMTFHQISQDQKGNRGLFMDAMHSIYLGSTHIFVTNDFHFPTLRDKGLHSLFSRVCHISEIGFTGKLREIKVQPSREI